MPLLSPDSFADVVEDAVVLKGACAEKPNEDVLKLALLVVPELAAVAVAVRADVKEVGKEKLEAAAGAVAVGGEVAEDVSVDLLGDTTDSVAA